MRLSTLRWAICSTVALWLFLPLSGAQAGTVIAGSDQADLLLPQGIEVADYENSGYRLEVSDNRARVRVNAEPLLSQAPFKLPPSLTGPSSTGSPSTGSSSTGSPSTESSKQMVLHRLARPVVAGATTQYEAVTRLLDWVGRNIRYDLDRQASQDALSVLGRRTAYCTGLARLSVGLLEAIGIEAREVAGFTVGGGRGAQFHRWIETYYPDRGWVFSDPQFSLHYVPATYVRLASPMVRNGDQIGDRLVLLDRLNGLMPVDDFPLGDRRTTVRRNEANQVAAALFVSVEDGGPGRMILEGPGFRKALSLSRGEGVFLGVRPGVYSFQFLRSGLETIEGSIRFRGAERRWLQIPLSRLSTFRQHQILPSSQSPSES